MKASDFDIPALLRVPFVDLGRDLSGWDCVGIAAWMTRTAFGIETDHLLDGYVATDAFASKALAAAIKRRMEAFEVCQPRFGAWLLFRRFGEPTHVGWALNGQQMIHADDGGAVGGATTAGARASGTYVEDFTDQRWAARLLGAYWPKGARA